MKMEDKLGSETSAHKIHTPENHSRERIKISQHGPVLLWRMWSSCWQLLVVLTDLCYNICHGIDYP